MRSFANARTHSPQRSPLRQFRHRGGSESVWLEPALAETGALPSSACGSTALDSKGLELDQECRLKRLGDEASQRAQTAQREGKLRREGHRQRGRTDV